MLKPLTAAMALAAYALAASPVLAKPARVFPIAATPVLEDLFPVQPVAFPGGVTAYRDVPYQTVTGYRPQIIDIYVPAAKGPHPLVLYIHGGGWVAGHTRHSGAFANFPRVLAALAAEGFTVASLEYRLAAEAPFPAQLQDANAALRFLRAHAGQYRLDPARVGVWGGSAGGHLTAITALTCRNTTLDPAAGKDGCVQAAVTWYGVFDFAMMPGANDPSPIRSKFLGCDVACPADRVRAVSPVSYIDAKAPPFLLIHGDEDKQVPVAQSHLAEAALKAAKVPVKSIYIPGVDHSFIGKSPAETRRASLQAVNATFDFFHEKLGVPQK